MRDSLHMDIYDYSCRCGNKWTHSRLRYDTGGTPIPADEDKLPIQSMQHLALHTSHCFRCMQLVAGIGWTNPATIARANEQSIEDEMLS